jgi:hypothetical protein
MIIAMETGDDTKLWRISFMSENTPAWLGNIAHIWCDGNYQDMTLHEFVCQASDV